MRLIDGDELIDRLVSRKRGTQSSAALNNYAIVAVKEQMQLEEFRIGRLRGVDYENGRVSYVMIKDTDDEVKQFIQVTRCKDCKHWREVDGKIVAEGKYCAMWYALRSPEDFCSAAERRK